MLPVKTGIKYEVHIDARQDFSYSRPNAFCLEKDDYYETSCYKVCMRDSYIEQGFNCQPLTTGDKIFDDSRKLNICSTAHGVFEGTNLLVLTRSDVTIGELYPISSVLVALPTPQFFSIRATFDAVLSLPRLVHM